MMDSHVDHLESVIVTRRTRTRLISPETLPGMVKAFDFVTVLICAALAYVLYIFIIVGTEVSGDIGRHSVTAVLGAFLFVTGYERISGYKFQQLSNLRWQFTRVALVWFCVLSVLLMVAFVAKMSDSYSRGWVILWTDTTLGFLVLQRIALQAAIRHWSRKGVFSRGIVIIGAGEPGAKLIKRLGQGGAGQTSILGVFDDRHTRLSVQEPGLNLLGTTDDLLQYFNHTPIDEIIIALPLNAELRVKTIIDKLKVLPVDLRLSAEQLGDVCAIRKLDQGLGVLILDVVERPLKHWNGIAKWIEDRLLSALLLVAFAPAMLLIAIAIKLDSPGPVFFRQKRYGYSNNLITVYKFRTLRVDMTDTNASKLVTRDDDRITRVGRFLRRFSLDELPQLLNVIRGDMSIVGPRPHATLAKAGNQLYQDAVESYMARHRVKPGLTGWAQINGWRGETDTEEKIRKRVEHDLYYIENWSIWFDLRIICQTFLAIFSSEQAY